MGVKRAMDKVLAIVRQKAGPVYTYGPLIHNRQAVEMLEARGVAARTEFAEHETGTVLLRTHGVPPDVTQTLRAAGLQVEDGTCPHVLRGQRSIARRAAEGYNVIIVGDRDHDEVMGLAGHARGNCRIIASIDEAETVPVDGDVLVVAQTTFNKELFRRIVEALGARKPGIEIVDSICDATSERQAEARELARRVDAMVVVGGFHSANTNRLAEVSRSTGTPTFHVETADQLEAEPLAGYQTVGVTAGASTPSWIISTVIDRLRHIGRARSVPARFFSGLGAVVLDGNLYVAGGAAALTYAAIKLLGLQQDSVWDRVRLMVAAAGYIFAAYFLGRAAESRSLDSGLTRRGAFYQAHPRWMAALTVLFSVASVAALVKFGPVAVVLLAGSYATAVAYGLLMAPRQRGRLAFFRNVPASKDLLAAAGWTMVTVLVPVVAAGGASVYAVTAVAGYVFGMAFIRSVMFDFSDVMGDRLMGRDTLPALVGVVRARVVLAVLAGLTAVALAAGAAAGVVVGPANWMLVCSGYVLSYLVIFGTAVTASERRCAVVVDGGMWLAGLIAVAHVLWS